MIDVQSYFTNINDRIQDELNKAKYSIRVAMYSLNDKLLFSILCEKANNGIAVELVVSPKQLIQNQEKINLNELIEYGGNIFLFNHPSENYDDMHNKFCIIDFNTVITGSFNWTNQAKRNEENIVIIRDEITTQKYLVEFDNLKLGGYLALTNENDIQISFSASKSIIKNGEPVELVWNVSNVEYVDIFDLGIFDNKGSKSIEIFSNRNFTLTAENSSQKRQKTISVIIAEKPIAEFHISTKLVKKGQPIEITWNVENAITVKIDNGIGIVGLNGNKTVLPLHDTIYTLTAEGINCEISKTQTIKVVDFPLPIIKTLVVPMPEIKIQSDLIFIKTQIPRTLNLISTVPNICLSVPQINSITDRLCLPKILHIKQEIKTELSEIKKDINNHKKQKHFLKIKKFVFDQIQCYFSENPKITEIIKTIRKCYE
jgi:hypothetical protein